MLSERKVVHSTSPASATVFLLTLYILLPVTSSLLHHPTPPPTQFARVIDPSTSLSYSFSSPETLPVSFSKVVAPSSASGPSSPTSTPLDLLKHLKVPITSSSTTSTTHSTPSQTSNKCEVARTRCAYRMGCGMALQGYMISCADLISNRTDICSINCQTALIALMSTEEGEVLIDCDCDASPFCEMNKERIEVCRSEVMRARAVDSIVSCQTARAICMADLPCSTALTYYYDRCRGLFQGRKCNRLCRNSLDILNRQEKASKLKTCYCEGNEDFNCQRIKESTEQLCRDEDNSIALIPSTSSASPSFLKMQIRDVSSLVVSITTWLLILLPFFFTSLSRRR